MNSRLTAIVSISGTSVKHHWYENRADAARHAQTLSRDGHDIYWSMAEFNERTRKADHATHLQQFWLDLDCGEGKDYPTQRAALQAFVDSALPVPTLIVDSGYGLHVYWTLTDAVTPQQWKPVAERLKRACITRSLKADHAVTADVARILRVPGTTNYKNPDDPRPVKLLKAVGKKYNLAEFEAALPAVGPLPVARPADVPAEWDVDGDYPPALIENVVRGCQQVRAAARVQCNGTPEPLWRAVLSVVHRCENGERLIHTISKGDPRYDPSETQAKAEGTIGPATCGHFETVHPSGCAGCPNKGAVRSPIAIPAPAPVPEDKPDEAKVERPTEIGDWRITAKGVYRAVEVEGEVVKSWAVMTPVYGDTFRTKKGEAETDADDAKILLTWLRPDGKWRKTLMPLSLVGSPSRMMEWAGAQGLGTLIPNAKVWIMYIADLTNRLLSEKRVTEYYARLGWHSEDSEFVLGTKKVTPDGLEAATVERNSPLSGLKPAGNLDEWKRGVARLNQAGLEKHQFCVLAGFGAPLLQLMDVAGAAVSLAGASGRGKTLAARTALSIFGNPDQLFQSADASKNSIDVHLATLHSVPYLMDEVTSLSDRRIGDLLYMVANGRGKDTLTRTRGWSDGGSWRTLAFLTTNAPIMEASQSHLTEAQRNRAIELIIDKAVPADDASVLYAATSKNHGVAAEPYMHYVINNREAVRAVALRCVEYIKAEFSGRDAQRFGIWALAAAMAGGLIAHKLGLIDYDVMEVMRNVVPGLEEQAEETLTPEEQFVQVVREWLTQESARVAVSVGNNLGVVDDPVARLDGPDLYIHSAILRERLREQKVSMHVVQTFLERHARPGQRIRLAAGTPPVRAIAFPTKLIYGEDAR